MKRVFHMVDLFAGAGGTSEGFRRVCESRGIDFELTAVNHWPTAVETHAANHPDARHFCESVYEVDPMKVCPEGRLDCLAASPECIYHSVARGGGPCDEQSRSGAQDVLRWLEALDVRMVLIENVPEFQGWGPLYQRGPRKGQPIPRQRGSYFRRFLRDLRSLGYCIDYAVLNAADYGAYTARRRFFLLAKKRGRYIEWPHITHVEDDPDLFQAVWRSARDVIDWDLKGQSIFARQAGLIKGKRPLCENTIRRICYGLERFSGLKLDPWLVMLYGQSRARSIDLPLPTITNGNHLALCEPYLVYNRGTATARSIDRPLSALTTSGTHLNLVEPYLIQYHGGSDAKRRVYSIDAPLPTVDTSNRYGVIAPYLLPQQQGWDGRNVQSMDNPMPTITSRGADAVIEPFLVKYFTNGNNAVSVETPLPTITTKDRLGLVEGRTSGCQLDILYRMLEPHELARGMGFGDSYEFKGTKTDIKRQIGNAVEVHQSAALAGVVIEHFLKGVA